MPNQLKDNFVAFLSLFIAIIALSYTTWREEVTERNRNYRTASFEVLKNLGELQLIINYSYYQPDNTMGNPILGWGHVALITDLGQLLPPPIPESVDQLAKVWRSNWEKMKTDEKAADKISQEIDNSRQAVLDLIRKLK